METHTKAISGLELANGEDGVSGSSGGGKNLAHLIATSLFEHNSIMLFRESISHT